MQMNLLLAVGPLEIQIITVEHISELLMYTKAMLNLGPQSCFQKFLLIREIWSNLADENIQLDRDAGMTEPVF